MIRQDRCSELFGFAILKEFYDDPGFALMVKPKNNNPFYVLLVVVGVLFCITACAYGVMTVQELRAPSSGVWNDEPSHALSRFLDRHGFYIMLSEILLLAAATVGAIGTDELWERRSQQPAPATDDSIEDSPT